MSLEAPFKTAFDEILQRAELAKAKAQVPDNFDKLRMRISAARVLPRRLGDFFERFGFEPSSIYYDWAIRRERNFHYDSLRKEIIKIQEDPGAINNPREIIEQTLDSWQDQARGNAAAQAVAHSLQDLCKAEEGIWNFIPSFVMVLQLLSILGCISVFVNQIRDPNYTRAGLWKATILKFNFDVDLNMLGCVVTLYILLDQMQVLAFAQVVRMLPVRNYFLTLGSMVQLIMPSAVLMALAIQLNHEETAASGLGVVALLLFVYKLDSLFSNGLADFQNYAVTFYVNLINCPKKLMDVRDEGNWSNLDSFAGGDLSRLELPQATENDRLYGNGRDANREESSFLDKSKQISYYCGNTSGVTHLPSAYSAYLAYLSFLVTAVFAGFAIYTYVRFERAIRNL